MIIGVIGLGLIGASLAREFTNIGHSVLGLDKSGEVTSVAIQDKVIEGELSNNNIGSVDLLVFSVYSGATVELLANYSPQLRNGAIVIDTSGNKRLVVARMKELSREFPSVLFYGGHPMAGREVSGYSSSKLGLFLGARMLIVDINGDDKSYNVLDKLFRDIGFLGIIKTTAEAHDRNISYTSQLAHILSNAYIKSPTAIEYKNFSAGSFRDLTRVAGLNADMWSELMLDNADMLLSEIDTFIENITKVREALVLGDRELLAKVLDEGNIIKAKLGL